jgi:Uma2 family endonuclease
MEKVHTPEELLAIPDGHRFELIDGHLVERPLMGAEASLVAAAIIMIVRQFTLGRQLGPVFSDACGYQIFPDDPNRVRFPDVSFIRRGRLPDDKPPQGHVRIAPDLAVEVVSPNDLAYSIDDKIASFLLAGIRMLWIVYPETRTVWVIRPTGVSRLSAADEINGEDVLPGFTCRVEEFFVGL